MEEADGRVYCTFQNVSTARLAGAVASLASRGHRMEAGAPGADHWAAGSVVQKQASLAESGGGVCRGEGERGNRLGTMPKFLSSSNMGGCTGYIHGREVSETQVQSLTPLPTSCETLW